ncbi:MAG: hypothetical protein HRU20_15655 [Pseudomonadales bacterium]|nr:hypothetical protein [Pseudomonadales bacterium]
MSYSFLSRQQGFAIFEVLISSALCGFVLVAVMKMQSFSLKQTDAATRHFYLSFYTSELIQKIQANHHFSLDYLGRFQALNVDAPTVCTSYCSKSHLVKQDIDHYLFLMQKYFPDFEIAISKKSANTYTINTSWKSRDVKILSTKTYSQPFVL